MRLPITTVNTVHWLLKLVHTYTFLLCRFFHKVFANVILKSKSRKRGQVSLAQVALGGVSGPTGAHWCYWVPQGLEEEELELGILGVLPLSPHRCQQDRDPDNPQETLSPGDNSMGGFYSKAFQG